MRDYYYLILTFLLWSTSSAIVVNFKNTFPPFQSASVVITISTIISTLFLFLFEKSNLEKLFKCGLVCWLKIIVLGFFGFFLYPVCYFYGLHSGRPSEANVINYFWPLATLIFGFIFQVEQITLKKLSSIIFGFFGVVIAASTIPILRDSQQNLLSWNFQYIPAYLFAGFGALSFGLYSALRRKFIQQVKGNYAALDVKARFVGYLWVSFLCHVLINLFNLGNYSALQSYQLSLKGCVFIGIYSVFNFSLAYYLWAYAEKLPTFYTSMMAFLIPPISAITLSVLNNIPLNSNSIFGLVLIVVGLAIYQDYQSYITPLMGFLITFNLFGLLRISFPEKPAFAEIEFNISFGIVQTVVAIFSILASFILARTVQLYREERDLFVKIEDRLVRIAYLGDLDSDLVSSIDVYMNYMIDSEAKFDSFGLAELVLFDKQSRNYIAAIIKIFRNKFTSHEEIISFNNEIDDLQEKVSQWKFLKGESLSVFEWIILGLLIFATVSLVFVSRVNNRWHDFSTVALSSCLVLFMFAIREYDLRRPTKKSSFILMTQRISDLAQLPPYLPNDLISSTRITKELEKMFSQTTSKCIRTIRNGSTVDVILKHTTDIYHVASYALGIFIFILVSYIILR